MTAPTIGWLPIENSQWTELHWCVGTCRQTTRHRIVAWSERDGIRYRGVCVRCTQHREVR